MRNKLFGNNIEPSCMYCERAQVQKNGAICTINKSIENGKCKKFRYNPTMRTPITQAQVPISNVEAPVNNEQVEKESNQK